MHFRRVVLAALPLAVMLASGCDDGQDHDQIDSNTPALYGPAPYAPIGPDGTYGRPGWSSCSTCGQSSGGSGPARIAPNDSNGVGRGSVLSGSSNSGSANSGGAG